MTVMDALLTIAQVAATFAGFTALMSLIDIGGGQRLVSVASFRITMLMVQAVTTLFLCFLPSLLLELGIAEQTAWLAANAVLMAVILARFVSFFANFRQLPEGARSGINMVNIVLGTSVSILSGLLIVAAVLVPGSVPLTGVYLFGCLATLLIAVMAFVRLVQDLRPENSGED